MRKIIFPSILILMTSICLISCSKYESIDGKIGTVMIDKVQVVEPMANPEYGARSKIITDEEEVVEFIRLVINSEVRDKVNQSDIVDEGASRYLFFSNGKLKSEYYFNGNDTTKIFLNNDFYNVSYGKAKTTLFDIYEKSEAPIIIVDEKLNQIQPNE